MTMTVADVDSFRVTWAVPVPLVGSDRALLCSWLRVHGIDPRRVDNEGGVSVAAHPVLGEVIIYSGYQRDDRKGRLVLAYGSTSEVARRVRVQPLGMPVPVVLRERGEARAKAEGLRLPVAALLSGGKRG